ncbi:MAG: HD domain-containing protein [Bdellovibrio sp.]|nr:MAG: HD domain-containing protein [Bdellovibrio sp.]
MIEIKDPVWGLLELSKEENNIIDRELFQRLHFIRQLSTTYLVYPGAMHTRYGHSLGTMFLAGKIAEKLSLDVERARMYGLLHDIGHVAFSHDGEAVLIEKRLIKDHEELGKKLMKEVLEDSTYTVGELTRSKEAKLCYTGIGADRLDYLRRDAYYCGVSFGFNEYDALIGHVGQRRSSIYLTKGGLGPAESLYVSRYMMFFSVYLHRTVRIAGMMIKEALREGLDRGNISFEDMLYLGDDSVLHKLRGVEVADRLMRRELYKQAILVSRSRSEEVKEIEEELHKMGALVSYPGKVSKDDSPLIEEGGKLVKLEGLSPIVASLREGEKLRNNIVVACESRKVKLIKRMVEKALR